MKCSMCEIKFYGEILNEKPIELKRDYNYDEPQYKCLKYDNNKPNKQCLKYKYLGKILVTIPKNSKVCQDCFNLLYI